MTCFIGIDVSTTSAKALIINQDGRILGVASTEYAYQARHI